MDEFDFQKERIAFLGLTTVKGIGFWTLHKIRDSGASFYEALNRPKKHGLEKYLTPLNDDLIDIKAVKLDIWNSGEILAKDLAKRNVTLHFKEEKSFPSRLSNIPDGPWWLFVEGAVKALSMPTCTMVGSRKVTDDGIFITRMIISFLAGNNLATVSGLAHGIDQTVHVESLRYGLPTIGVLGTGILSNYPKGSEELRDSIVQAGGAIITEYLPNQSYSAENFVRRNRLQAALGDVLIPCEWAIKSGTAHTVKFAKKYNKKIINAYLPFSLESRPEVEFSVKRYSALAIEIPKNLGLLGNELKQSFSVASDIPSLESENAYIKDAESQTGNDEQFKLDM